MKFTEKLIQKALFKKFNHHKYKFFNAYFFENESDVLTFLPNGICYEIEIKISIADFKADFKKNKHVIHVSNNSQEKHFLKKGSIVYNPNPSWDLCKEYPELIESKNHEYQYYKNPISFKIQSSCGIHIGEVKNKLLPNKFFFACPKGLIKIEDVPDYAGLLYIDDELKVIKIKDGKFIHKEKLDAKIRLFDKMYNFYESENSIKFYNI